MALSAFDKKELDPYPRSWKEYRALKPTESFNIIVPESIFGSLHAFAALLLLRQEWLYVWSQEQGLEKDWEPDWDDNSKTKYVIMLKSKACGGIVVDDRATWSSPLSFSTIDLAIDFMNTFKLLLEQAKGLY